MMRFRLLFSECHWVQYETYGQFNDGLIKPKISTIFAITVALILFYPVTLRSLQIASTAPGLKS